jgi:hypothetical protein
MEVKTSWTEHCNGHVLSWRSGSMFYNFIIKWCGLNHVFPSVNDPVHLLLNSSDCSCLLFSQRGKSPWDKLCYLFAEGFQNCVFFLILCKDFASLTGWQDLAETDMLLYLVLLYGDVVPAYWCIIEFLYMFITFIVRNVLCETTPFEWKCTCCKIFMYFKQIYTYKCLILKDF